MSNHPLHVAVVGGGLCGLALAIALEKRKVSYTVYESHSSFTEIGAGLNLGPNSIRAFDAIDPKLSENIFALATRNAPGGEEIWMNLRLAASTNHFEDAHFIMALHGPPTGNMTVSRNELLQLLAHSIPPERTRFNKKITAASQSATAVTMHFADGSEESASIVIGCDGAHSTVRTILLGEDHPGARARYTGVGGYRAIFPMEVYERAVGVEIAHMGHLWCGPGGYVTQYPIDSGRNVNVGLWAKKPGDWDKHSWVLDHQKPQMLEDFAAWGPTIRKVMSLMSDQTQFWATFHHDVQPEHFFDGRICMIGDAAHCMPPHQGQGAAQAMEDASVMGELIYRVSTLASGTPSSQQIEAAFLAYEAARRERFEAVAHASVGAHPFWGSICREDLTEDDLERFRRAAYDRFTWIWNKDIVGQQQAAVAEMEKLSKKRLSSKM